MNYSKLALSTVLATAAALPVMAAGISSTSNLGVNTPLLGAKVNTGVQTKTGNRAVKGNVTSSIRGNTDADVRSGASFKDSPADNITSGDAKVRAGMNTGSNAELGTGTGMGTGTGIGAGMGVGTGAGINTSGGGAGASVGGSAHGGASTH